MGAMQIRFTKLILSKASNNIILKFVKPAQFHGQYSCMKEDASLSFYPLCNNMELTCLEIQLCETEGMAA